MAFGAAVHVSILCSEGGQDFLRPAVTPTLGQGHHRDNMFEAEKSQISATYQADQSGDDQALEDRGPSRIVITGWAARGEGSLQNLVASRKWRSPQKSIPWNYEVEGITVPPALPASTSRAWISIMKFPEQRPCQRPCQALAPGSSYCWAWRPTNSEELVGRENTSRVSWSQMNPTKQNVESRRRDL